MLMCQTSVILLVDFLIQQEIAVWFRIMLREPGSLGQKSLSLAKAFHNRLKGYDIFAYFTVE